MGNSSIHPYVWVRMHFLAYLFQVCSRSPGNNIWNKYAKKCLRTHTHSMCVGPKEFLGMFIWSIFPMWVGKICEINMLKNAFGPTRMETLHWKMYPKRVIGYIFLGNSSIRVGPKAFLAYLFQVVSRSLGNNTWNKFAKKCHRTHTHGSIFLENISENSVRIYFRWKLFHACGSENMFKHICFKYSSHAHGKTTSNKYA